MAFSLAQFAFNHGVSSYQFMRDSGRRALALAGSEQAVWDWQVHDGSLYVGAELERALGLTPGTVGGSDLARWLDIIHPADRAVYVSSVEGAERRGRGSFSQDFRLRRADGSYRWYMLRARSMIGEDGSVMRLIGTLADVTADKRSEERLLSDAVRDRVTGLPNKALFIDRLQRAVARARDRRDVELFVMVIDFDRFKSINDGLGHEAGDSILSVAGRRLTQLMGPEDSVGRLPGDQFGIVFDANHPRRDVMAYTEALRTAMAQPIRLRNREILLTASIGIAHFSIAREQPEDLLKDAEIALFEAKRRGRGMIEFFRSDMRNETSELVALEQDLRRAVERDEIEVVYQPIMRLSDDQLAGFEALARWRHPKEGLLQPASFMGLAEETGIIRDIGRHVLNEAARQLGIWQRAFRPSDPLFVAVNVSSAQLIDFDLVADIKGLLAREDIHPGTLKLELTETLVMENPELSAKVLERIGQLGIGLACDDFGTGYSALANLARLPFDTLKIDRVFLEADTEDERATIILDTIIMLAHDLDLDVVVEGVENGDQVEHLKDLECDLVQGFYIGQPATAAQVLNALGGLPFGTETPRGARSTFWDLLRGIGRSPDDEADRQRAAAPRRAPPAASSGPPPPATAPPPSRTATPEAEPPIEVWPSDDIEERRAVETSNKPVPPAAAEIPPPPPVKPPPTVATGNGAPAKQPGPAGEAG
ncbi:MAG: putative bifunctional diguanylate cyclase/phosphodiesterase, partial [Aestuariivirgaceae bacterium]